MRSSRAAYLTAVGVGLMFISVPPVCAFDARPETTWVMTFDHDFYNWADAHIDTFEFPPDSLLWKKIILFYKIQCPGPPGDCDPWDRLGHLRVIETDELGEETHYEIARIITPYDITGGTRPDSCIWELDVSDYESLLYDQVVLRHQISSWIGGNRGWIVTIEFAFISGTTAQEPYQVRNLWTGDYMVYGDPDNPIEQYLLPITVEIPPEIQAAKFRAIVTGHGQGNTDNAAEFAYKWHEVVVGSDVFSHYLWRNDCELNRCSPQGGTWQYDRAGWCPGDKVVPWDLAVFNSLTPGDSISIDYNIQPYVNECRPTNPECVDGVTCPDCDYNSTGHTEPHFVLNTQLILYRERMIQLSGQLVAGDVMLWWQEWPGTSAYWVFGEANVPHFDPDLIPPFGNRLAVLQPETVTWTSSFGVGDPESNWTYQVVAVNDLGEMIARSTRIGEHDFEQIVP